MGRRADGGGGEEGRQGRAGGGRRVGPVCRNVAVATTLWNLLEAVSVVDDDEVRVWRWRFYREPLVKKKKKAKPVAAPQKKSVVPLQKKKTL